ncbi:hypothetical protein QDW26_gp41 [Microbacterium phage Didgeridoo]|uniref:hypothetical protein n=1 Tax=Microbacterium phage Didgeridoo TaxID=2126928 RepID=UPI000D204AB5|nr:hypothetical protein QDW26_gp41 [Microbacterium phage Didgeridoo]AVR56707.1 hypothetical protein PBI_DIDGERIDOO_42 [Microbacterium phage Didgeridoo]WMI34057.1 hypothetical protein FINALFRONTIER_40 [Microbacterium phage Finalfrontier]
MSIAAVAQRARQNETIPAAIHNGAPWTPDSDAVIAASISQIEMARITGRTYWAVGSRRQALGIPNPHNQVDKPEGPLLCPCGTLDPEHESWCPNAD